MHLLYPLSIVLLWVSEFLFVQVFDPAFRESAAIFNVYLLILTNRLIFPHTVIIGFEG